MIFRVLAILAWLLGASRFARAEAPTTLRVSVLASENGKFGAITKQWADAITGRIPVKVDVHYDGKDGDEPTVVKRLEHGQTDIATIAQIGFQKVATDLRVLELPLLFRDERELDAVRAALADDLALRLAKHDLVLLGWFDNDWSYLLSRKPLAGIGSLAGFSFGASPDDPIATAFLGKLGGKAQPRRDRIDTWLTLAEGKLDVALVAPLEAHVLSLHDKMKFRSAIPIARTVGVMVIRKQAWDALPEPQQRAIVEETLALEKRSRALTQEGVAWAFGEFAKKKVRVDKLAPAFVAKMEKAAKQVAADGDDKLYSAALHKKIVAQLAGRRGKK